MKSQEDGPLREGSELLSEAVQKQLNRLLASEFFRPSARLQLLLRTIVKESLAGRNEALKEVVLGKDVFGRPDYDPKRDTLVRVEINAVRRKLAEYHMKAGAEDRVRIDIPLGHYVAVFTPLSAKPPAPRRLRVWHVLLGCALALTVSLAARWALWHPPARTGLPIQITFDTGWTSQPAISRDGSVLVYSSDRGPRGNADIWIQQPGAAPRQLTNDPAHHITPDISPDGRTVVFRSWRKEAGVWSVSAAGGKARLLAKGGFCPRFSADGKWIAFDGLGTDETAHIFIIPAEGGLPERLDYGTEEAGCPVWSPDATDVVFAARSSKDGAFDFWAARVRGPRGALSQPVGIQAKLRAQNLPAISSNVDSPQDWIDDRLLFVVHQRDTSFLFQTSLSSSGRLGEIRPIPAAFGAAGVRAVQGPAGRRYLLFAAEHQQTNIWAYSPGGGLGGSTPLEQLTHDDSLRSGYTGTWPALSGDGNLLAYITERAGSPDICLKDLRSGAEQLLGAAPRAQSPVFLDRNGGRAVFVRQKGSAASVFLRNVAEKTDRLLTADCPILHDWSPDGESLLCGEDKSLFRSYISRPGRTPLLRLTHPPVQARFSPDDRWISFVTETGRGENTGFLAPLDGSNRRIQICQEVYGLSLHWAPGGNAIYYWSTQDGFRCLYMQRLQPNTKVPQGSPIAILHRHALQRYPWSGGTLATGSGTMAMTLKDELANIWTVDLPR